MRRIAAALLFCLSAVAQAGSLADVEVFDTTEGRTLPVHEHRGRLYLVGEPGHRYEVRVRSRAHERVLAVTSVDGVNVVTGETAATSQSGYVVESWSSVNIDGWRKSLDEVARFYFTSLPDSYAARTGRPNDVGVIGVALFRERRPPERHQQLEQRQERAAATASPSADAQSSARSPAPSLGTGHGERESSSAQYVDFRRASSTPEEIITIYYDSHRNLVAQGVLPKRRHVAQRAPQPFPAGFVPDP